MTARVTIADEIVREVPRPRYSGSWQRDPDDPATFEDASGWDELAAAIGWGRARAPYVFLDLNELPFDYERVEVGAESDGLPRWGGELPDDLPAVPSYGGVVYLRDEATYRQTSRYVAVAESGERAVLEDLESAIDWGRARAAVVVAELMPESWHAPPPPEPLRYSAGEAEPEGEALPRLRPKSVEDVMDWTVSIQDARYRVTASTRKEAQRLGLERYLDDYPPTAPGGWTLSVEGVEPAE